MRALHTFTARAISYLRPIMESWESYCMPAWYVHTAWYPAYCSPPAPPCNSPAQDCDGVILESTELNRTAYNAAFKHYNVHNGETMRGEAAQYFVSQLQDYIIP